MRAWIKGDFYGAVQHWEAVLVKYPLDLFALELAQQVLDEEKDEE